MHNITHRWLHIAGLLLVITIMGCPAPAPSAELVEPERSPTFDVLVAIEKGWRPAHRALIGVPDQSKALLSTTRDASRAMARAGVNGAGSTTSTHT